MTTGVKQPSLAKDQRKADCKMARQLIDQGFKGMALVLHPDHGGSKEAMVRLGRIRAQMKKDWK